MNEAIKYEKKEQILARQKNVLKYFVLKHKLFYICAINVTMLVHRIKTDQL